MLETPYYSSVTCLCALFPFFTLLNHNLPRQTYYSDTYLQLNVLPKVWLEKLTRGKKASIFGSGINALVKHIYRRDFVKYFVIVIASVKLFFLICLFALWLSTPFDMIWKCLNSKAFYGSIWVFKRDCLLEITSLPPPPNYCWSSWSSCFRCRIVSSTAIHILIPISETPRKRVLAVYYFGVLCGPVVIEFEYLLNIHANFSFNISAFKDIF